MRVGFWGEESEEAKFGQDCCRKEKFSRSKSWKPRLAESRDLVHPCWRILPSVISWRSYLHSVFVITSISSSTLERGTETPSRLQRVTKKGGRQEGGGWVGQWKPGVNTGSLFRTFKFRDLDALEMEKGWLWKGIVSVGSHLLRERFKTNWKLIEIHTLLHSLWRCGPSSAGVVTCLKTNWPCTQFCCCAFHKIK